MAKNTPYELRLDGRRALFDQDVKLYPLIQVVLDISTCV